ncbi:TetR/AcrR family transcriptional regulator [Corynebacterium sp. MSK039]|uniref:TetR/AcrR family transcriptional regulator n=1 Tax=Corynebacterium sp. MSK039 TaxID=3050193 RepID=UPI00254ABC0F|nr:TetR/AcrR family transcriptional regulator [Corynebacterium sp. MSK039]MDK8791580.1 TetR/AcrR family transcriptional regulator [Corynebacterium sp. MSK039]
MDYREVKKAATRRSISEATVQLMLEHPDRMPTVAQISDRADISVRTFHNYFADTDEAIFEFLRQTFDKISDQINALPEQWTAAQAMEAIASDALNDDGVELYSASTLVLLGSHASSRSRRPPSEETVTEISSSMMKALKNRIPGATHFDAQVLIGAYSAASGVAIREYLDRPEPRDPEEGRELIRRAFQLLRDYE